MTFLYAPATLWPKVKRIYITLFSFDKIFLSATQGHKLVYARQAFLAMLFCFILFSYAQAQSVGERSDAGLTHIKPLQIVDTIPDELWHLPLQVVNHPDGKDTITLNDYRDEKLIILDFWASYCSPCIKSISKIDSILKDSDLASHSVLLPVLVHDAPERGTKFLKDWGKDLWSIDDSNFTLKTWFSNYISGFGAILISEGKFLAAPIPKDITSNKLKNQIYNRHVDWINVRMKGVQP